MKTPFFFICLALPATLFPFCMRAGIDPLYAQGSRAAALAYAYAGVSGDLWSQSLNPAGLPGLSRPAAGLYAEQPYLLPALGAGGALFALPFQQGKQTLGMALRHLGFEAYREQRISLSYANLFFERLSLGASLQYVQISIPQYGKESILWLDLGLQASVAPALDLGISIQNASRARWHSREVTEPVITAGLAYHPGPRLTILADLRKAAGHPPSFCAGMEYYLTERLCLRTGSSTGPLRWTSGLGIRQFGWQIDLSLGYHPHMGFSPQASLQYFLHGKPGA